MEDDALNMHNWGGYYEPSRGNLSLHLMSNMSDREVKHFIPRRDTGNMFGANGAFHPRDCLAVDGSVPMNYLREGWLNQRDKYYNMIPPNPSYSFLAQNSGAHSIQVPQPINTLREERAPAIEEPSTNDKEGSSLPKKRKKGEATKSSKGKKPKKQKDDDYVPVQRMKTSKKSMDVVINGIDMDISGIPIPVCSCTGTPQQCYRWGCGGWQSACCTTNVSVYPLPMSTKRRGSRIAGRKMSLGAFKKVLEKLAAEGYNFSNPIDLRTYWAKHGTNKFVTIR